MTFTLKKTDFEFLKEKSPEAYARMQDVTESEVVSFTVDKDDVVEMQLDINDTIVQKGMHKQDTVNKIGIRLYEIYDELLAQI